MAVTQLAKYLVVASLLCSIQILAQAKSISPADESAIIQDVENAVRTVDGGVETALLNYLLAKQITERLNSNTDSHDLQQKRSYWKHCAFNAVTCFGK